MRASQQDNHSMDAVRTADQPAPLSHAEVRTIISGVLLAMFLAALDQTIVATALPTIGRELHNVTDLPWVVTAYLLAATAATPLYGKFSDIHGRRVTMLFGIATFMVGSLICALAPNMLVLIVARGLQGLGGGGLISLAQTVVADVAAPRERGRYQAYFAAVFTSSSLAGPVLGGVIAEHLHWSVIFWINLPLGLLAYVITSRTLRRLPRNDHWHRLDMLGAALITAASVTLMLALNWGGVRYAWTSPQLLSLFVGSLVLWGLFTTRLLTAEEPLIPLSVLRNGVVRAGTISSCFGMGTLIAMTVFMPLYFEAVMGLTAGQSGLALIPLSVSVVLGATLVGRRLAHVVHYKRLPLVGLLIATGGCIALALLAGSISLFALDATLALISIGMGTLLPVTTVAVQNAVVPRELGTTTAAIGFFRQLGGALMVALFGAVVLGLGAVHGDAAREALQVAANPEQTGRFSAMFLVAAAGYALAFLFFLGMEERPLRGRAGPAE
jgi:EmrB/QacA subfamily drug resistance transporter